MPRRTDTRARMLAAAEGVLAAKGYLATSLADIVKMSGTPRGSVYFHFPGGKDQIVVETVESLATSVPEAVRVIARDCASPVELVRRFFEENAKIFEESGHTRGCPVATTVLEMSESDLLRPALNRVFEEWRSAFAESFSSAGVEPVAASAAAAMILAGFEGALIQARAEQSSTIIRRVGEELASCLELKHFDRRRKR